MGPLTKFSSVFLWSVFLIFEGNIVSGEIEMNEICIICEVKYRVNYGENIMSG